MEKAEGKGFKRKPPPSLIRCNTAFAALIIDEMRESLRLNKASTTR